MRTQSKSPVPAGGDALDQLGYEDRALLEILDEFDDQRLDRLRHGIAGKLLVEHLAVREAARESVADSLMADPKMADLALLFEQGLSERRRHLAQLDEMARGVRPINLNQGQNFDQQVEGIEPSLRSELCREVFDLIPEVRRRTPLSLRRRMFAKARRVRRSAPTHPNPQGRRRYERIRILVRLHALYDWLRGFPTGGPAPSRDIDISRSDRRAG